MSPSPPTGGGPLEAEAARRVRLVVFDVDGVLTDAGVYIGATASGETVEMKRFDIQDGVGLKMLMWAGLQVAIVSGRVSEATELRARELGVECHQDPEARKLPTVERILEREGLSWSEVAMLADDVPDLAVFTRVGLPAAVANATAPVLESARWRSSRPGGSGAAREFCDALLTARGELDRVIEAYVRSRSEGA